MSQATGPEESAPGAASPEPPKDAADAEGRAPEQASPTDADQGDGAATAQPDGAGTAPAETPDAKAGKPDTPEKPRPPRPTVVVRYGAMRSIGEFRHNFDAPIRRGTKLVIRSERGVELGEVIVPVCDTCDSLHVTGDKLKQFVGSNGPDYPFRRDGRILRLANPQDVIDYRHLQQSAREAATYCRQEIREMNLDMRLVAVEHLLGGERLVFYFAAEHRVDFRELVRRLASQYRTRIEMRQVGARDEARLVADYERCGQQCCCQSFLKDLRPVSMRMAKTQKATLDPSKISGRCGRLMCCLRYEDSTYEQLRKKLPRKNTWVRTADDVVGRVVDTQIITQLVRLQLLDSTFVAVGNDEIVERNMDAPPKPQPPAAPPRKPPRTEPRKRERLGAAAEAEAEARRAAGQAEATAGDSAAPRAEQAAAAGAGAEPAGGDSGPPSSRGEGAPTKKRRRRRRKKAPRDASKASGNAQRQPAQRKGQGASQGSSNGQHGTGTDKPSGEKKKPRRRRRRRKKGPRSGQGHSPESGGG